MKSIIYTIFLLIFSVNTYASNHEIYTFKESTLVNLTPNTLKFRNEYNDLIILMPDEQVSFNNALLFLAEENSCSIKFTLNEGKTIVIAESLEGTNYSAFSSSCHHNDSDDWCYDYCSSLALPTGDGLGWDFWNCLTLCQASPQSAPCR